VERLQEEINRSQSELEKLKQELELGLAKYNNTKQKHDEAYQAFTSLESETTALKSKVKDTTKAAMKIRENQRQNQIMLKEKAESIQKLRSQMESIDQQIVQ
jgi:chromosome segregation ATPase